MSSFSQIDADLSGASKLHIYLWKRRVRAKNCLCGDMTVLDRPKQFASVARNQERIKSAFHRGVRIISHPDLIFELHVNYLKPDASHQSTFSLLPDTSSAELKPAIIDIQIAACLQVPELFLSTTYHIGQ
jgi:hypothetical protein